MQIITPDSDSADVLSFVEDHIYIDSAGAKRVNQSTLAQALSEQFDYLNGPDSYASPIDKHQQATTIAAKLASVVDRENWASDPNYPSGDSATGQYDAARARLVSLKSQLQIEVRDLEGAYAESSWSLNAKVKTLWNAIVLPTYPQGIERIEVTQAYIETFVTDRGEESMPSSVSALVTLDQNDTVTVSCNSAPSGRNITHRRLYRSVTGTSQAAFKLQGEYPVSTTSIVDAKNDAELEDDVCETFGWLEPPATLKGLTGLPNGIMVGYDGSTLYACEPYKPYAWPARYDKPLGREITGTCALGQSVFVGTTGRPFLVSGADSASLSEELISSKVPCVSARSMVAIGNSVLYASPDGLAVYAGGTVSIATKGVIDGAKWREYVPESMIAAEYDGQYLCFFTRGDSSKGALSFDLESRSIAELECEADAVFSNADSLFILDGTTIYDLFPDAGANRTAKSHSKTYRLNRPESMSWFQLDGDFQNDGDPVSATVKLYADGNLVQTLTVPDSKPQRVVPGKFTEWRVEIEAACRIHGFVLASTTDELKGAQ